MQIYSAQESKNLWFSRNNPPNTSSYCMKNSSAVDSKSPNTTAYVLMKFHELGRQQLGRNLVKYGRSNKSGFEPPCLDSSSFQSHILFGVK